MSLTQILEEKAVSSGMSSAESAEFIRNCDQFRTMKDKMKRFSDEGDLRSRLLAGLSVCHPEMRQDSLERKVRSWLNSRPDMVLDRKTIMELAFILELTTAQADAFLTLMADEGFRWRDPDEIISVFAFNHRMDYAAAEQLRREIGTVKATADVSDSPDEYLTDVVRQEVMQLTSREELSQYLQENSAKFGKCRNRAWQLFSRYMERLKQPPLDPNLRRLTEHGHLKSEAPMTTATILKTYLHSQLIPRGEKRDNILDSSRVNRDQRAVLSSILAAWPDENSLLKMARRQIPVGRKALILLFLSLDDDVEQDDDDFFDLTPEEKVRDLFESRRSRLNLMLGSCGYRLLDSRNPFDWMILYAISIADMFDSDNRLDELLTELFGGSQK